MSNLHTEILVGAIVVLLTVHFSLAWTTPVNISNTPGCSQQSALAIDGQGHVHVVWTDDTSGSNDILYRNYNGETWSPTINLSNDATDSERSDIVIDSPGRIHVVWKNHHLGEVFWTYCDGLSWKSPINISNNSGYSTCPRLTADDSGKVYVVWHDIQGQSDIYFSIYDGSSWSEPQNITDDSVDSSYPDIAVDSSRNVHLVWMNYGPDIEVFYSRYDGSMWSNRVNISNRAGYSVDPKIDLYSQNNPHVVWEERKDGLHIYYSSYDGFEWTASEELSTGDRNTRPAIAIDPGNKIYVMWTKGFNKGLKLEWRYYDISWSDYFIVPTPPSRASAPQIRINKKDLLHLTYSDDAKLNRDIFYTRCSFTGVEGEQKGDLPHLFQLDQNYPNPFNPETTIRYSLIGNEPIHVTLRIYNLLGKKVLSIIDEEQEPGSHEVIWDGRDKKGTAVSSGVYFYRLQAGGFEATSKMVMLR